MNEGFLKNFNCLMCFGSFYVQLKEINYCKNCFIEYCLRKFRKSFKKLPKVGKIIVLVENSIQSAVMIHILKCIFNKKSGKELHYLNVSKKVPTKGIFEHENTISLNNFFSETEEFGEQIFKSNILKFAKDNEFNGITFGKDLEQSVAYSIKDLLLGKGRLCALNAQDRKIDNISIINLFSRFSRKAILSYFFLYKKELPFIAKKEDKNVFSKITEDFLSKIKQRNYGACESFIEALQKIETKGIEFCVLCFKLHDNKSECA